MAIDSWSLVRVYATWVDHTGAKIPGKYKITVPHRLTNATDDLIIPAGIFAPRPPDPGELVLASGVPSLSVMCPATDDPDIQEDGWRVTIEVSFTGGQATERYTIDVPVADRPIADGGTGAGVNLRKIALPQLLPPQVAMYGVGRPMGLALLDETGLAVLDANGDPIVGGGGGADWDTITDKPAVIAAGADAAAARAAIGAQPAGSYLTSVPDATTTVKGAAQLATTTEATTGTNTTKAVTPAGVKAAVDALVAGAPGALDTLNELAAALGGDASFSATVASSLAARVRTDTASQGLNSTQQANARANIGAADAATAGGIRTVQWTDGAYPTQAASPPAGVTTRIFVGPVTYSGPSWAGVSDIYVYQP